jgi:hypothetical protein
VLSLALQRDFLRKKPCAQPSFAEELSPKVPVLKTQKEKEKTFLDVVTPSRQHIRYEWLFSC